MRCRKSTRRGQLRRSLSRPYGLPKLKLGVARCQDSNLDLPISHEEELPGRGSRVRGQAPLAGPDRPVWERPGHRGGNRARTGDLRVMSPARYQLRYPAPCGELAPAGFRVIRVLASLPTLAFTGGGTSRGLPRTGEQGDGPPFYNPVPPSACPLGTWGNIAGADGISDVTA